MSQHSLKVYQRQALDATKRIKNWFTRRTQDLPKPKFSSESVDLRAAYQVYDKLTGLDQVRTAHENVTQAEKVFIEHQIERRSCQTECFQLEESRNRLNAQLDGVSRSDETFLILVTQLHELSRKHKEARQKLSNIELAEQLAFDQFSTALRQSQAEERVQANRMRQWSIGLGVLSGLLGFGITWLRFHHPHDTGAVVVMNSSTFDPLWKSALSELQGTTDHLKQTAATLAKSMNEIQSRIDSNSKEEPPAPTSSPPINWATVLPLTFGVISLVLLLIGSGTR